MPTQTDPQDLVAQVLAKRADQRAAYLAAKPPQPAPPAADPAAAAAAAAELAQLESQIDPWIEMSDCPATRAQHNQLMGRIYTLRALCARS